eukprot:TRINITY_DN10683_c0_g1_i1.p1 TRINITY_DN10683_c0_g1~~TRINITY_DN10683_c0_g1_i1.p1  ORF type:complete len:417 (-),score=75.11 TRINITY_DN10683_c0_g1_i1:4-1254(-)
MCIRDRVSTQSTGTMNRGDDIIIEYPHESNKKRQIKYFSLITLIVLAIAAVVFFMFFIGFDRPPSDAYERALWLHSKYPLIDTHNDLPFMMRDYFNYNLTAHDVSLDQNFTATDIPKLRAGRLGAQFWSVFIPCGADAIKGTLEQMNFVYDLIAKYPNVFELVTTSNGIKSAFKRGKIGSLMGVEGGHQINSSLGTLDMFYQLGARYMTITHNCNTPWAESAQPIGTDSYPGTIGLTEFGREVIYRMNRLGMMVDISHVADRTAHEVLDITAAPVIFSHSGARNVTNHIRNVPDDVLLRLPENGGVVMVPFLPLFLTENYLEVETNVSNVADHIDYIKNLIGVDYVGYGSDFDGTSMSMPYPDGLEDVSKYPYVTAELISRGYSDSDIKKVIGDNILRVFAENERVAQKLSKQQQG